MPIYDQGLAYAAAKAALTTHSKGVATPHGIRVDTRPRAQLPFPCVHRGRVNAGLVG